MSSKYILGLDVGIASCGWSLVSLDEQDVPNRIVDLGVRIFDPGEDSQGQSLNLERREKRCARRVLRRRKHRVDRVRRLLYDYNILDAQSSDYQTLKDAFSQNVATYYKTHVTNPFLLKEKALDKKLNNDELMIILVHYAKYRGYLSNRKVEEDSAPKEDRKVLSQIHENESRLQSYRTVSEMFNNDPYFADRIHNDPNSYKMSVTRQMYKAEIEAVLDKQIEFGLIPTDFKEKYLEIWSSQRHYAEGPGYYITTDEHGNKIKVRSPYGGNLIERMIGTCQFDGLPRAPKNAPSVELFRSVQSLVNFRYKEATDEIYRSLTSEEIDLIINALQEQEKITYKKLNQLLKKNIVSIRNGSNTKKEFMNALKKFQEKDWKGDPEEKIKIAELSQEDKRQFEKRLNDEVMSRPFVSMSTYSVLRKKFLGFGTEEWKLIRSNFEMLDEIIRILTSYKTDSDIRDQVKKSELINDKYLETILELPNFTGHIHLSLDLVKRLIPQMILLGGYDKAMEELGYNFTDLVSVKEKQDLLPTIPVQDIRNQRVVRSLSQTRKVINAVIKQYGLPKRVHVEVASELAKSMDERRRIEREQMNHQADNMKTKQLLVTTFPQIFRTIDDVKPFDLQKYRLWQEQGEFCPYSLEKITIEELFSDNQVQVDHILPYSRTYNDNYYNKTLVKTRANQEKGDRTPYEWMQATTERWNRFVNFIESCSTIPLQKKTNYLYKNLDTEKESEWKNQNLNDTKYIARYLVQFIKGYLNVETVLPVKGAITDRLKSRWGLTHVTHSLEQEGYYLPKKESVKKNRGNHLHHALDACIVAVTTPSLIKRVTEYEKLKRYLNSALVQKDIDEVYDTVTYYNKTTGEVITEHDFNGNVDIEELNEYLLEELKNHSIVRGKKRYCIYYPTPYKDFKREVLLRVFEQNPIILQRDLKMLDNYFDVPTRNIYPIIPSIAKSKSGGALHKETYYGIREYQDADQTIKMETERVSVNSPRLTLKLLAKMIDRDGGAKSNYETLASWLGNYDNGAEAYQKQGYPVNPKSKQTIKRVVLEHGIFENKKYLLNEKCSVDIGSIEKVYIYKKKNSEESNLYFTGLDTLKVLKLKEIERNSHLTLDSRNGLKAEALTVVLTWGQGKKNKVVTYKELLRDYEIYLKLDKRDFIKVTLQNGNYGYCYLCGSYASGQLEVISPLGDGYDLIGTDNLFSIIRRPLLTVSTIVDIEKINLSILGKIQREKKNGISTSNCEEGREAFAK